MQLYKGRERWLELLRYSFERVDATYAVAGSQERRELFVIRRIRLGT